MKKIPLFFLVFFLLLILPTHSSVWASQFFPQPGTNCGVGLDSDEYSPGNPEHQKYNCCYSNVADALNIDASSFGGLPAASLIGPVIDFVNGRIDSFPFFLLPNAIAEKLPSIGGIKKILKSDVKPCLPPANPVGTIDSNECYCRLNVTQSLTSIVRLCDNIKNETEKNDCQSCLGYDPEKKTYSKGSGIWTAIGCIKTTFSSFIQETLFGLGIQLAGIVSLLCIIYAAFTMQTSMGNPEKIKKAQQLLTSCITGLLLVIFSVFILRLIGVNILKIPGFQ